MICVLQEAPNAFNMVAPDCGSFTVVSRGTSLRSAITPLGREGLPFVFRGNGTISRWGFQTKTYLIFPNSFGGSFCLKKKVPKTEAQKHSFKWEDVLPKWKPKMEAQQGSSPDRY